MAINQKNKKIIIAAIIAIILVTIGITGTYLWKKKSKEADAQKAEETLEKVKEESAKGVLPSIETNPLENKPNLNPADKANPFKDIKLNPFE